MKIGIQSKGIFSAALLAFSVTVLSPEPAHAATMNDKQIWCAAAQLLELMEGNLGALIMVVAGIATIIASAFGAYRAATSMLVVAVGAFTLRSFVSIFFNDVPQYDDSCKNGRAGAASAEGSNGIGGALNQIGNSLLGPGGGRLVEDIGNGAMQEMMGTNEVGPPQTKYTGTPGIVSSNDLGNGQPTSPP